MENPPIPEPQSYPQPPAQPADGQGIDTAWGIDVHQLVFGLAAPGIFEPVLGPQAGMNAPEGAYPFGLSMLNTCDASWGGCWLVMTFRGGVGWCAQMRLNVQVDNAQFRVWHDPTGWGPWTPNLYLVSRDIAETQPNG
jgi:hypothetical protein